MTKYYKVIKDMPLWEIDAILEFREDLGSEGGYSPIEDIWNKTENQTEYLSRDIVEAKEHKDFFQRVYKSGTEKIMYITAEALKKLHKKFTE